MSEIKKTNKKDIPIWLCFLIVALCVLLAYFNSFLGAVAFAVASIIAYYTDRLYKIPYTSTMIFIAGIIIYLLNVNFTPVFSTMLLISSFTALGCIVTNLVFQDVKFYEGLIYTVIFSIIAMIGATALYYYVISDKQLVEAALINLENYLSNSDSQMVQYFMAAISRNMEIVESNASIVELFKPIQIQDKSIILENSMEFFTQSIKSKYASFIIIFPLGSASIVWWLGNKLKYRTIAMTKEAPKQKPKPFAAFRHPRWMINVIMFILIVSFFVKIYSSSVTSIYIAIALQDISLFLLAIQGIAVIEFILKRNKVLSNTLLRSIVHLLIIIVFAGIIPLMIGMMDVLINIRYIIANQNARRL